MPLSEAKALVKRSHSAPHASRSNAVQEEKSARLNLFLHEPQKDQLALEALADSLELFSPIIGLQQAHQPDCIFLDITGLAHLFRGEEQLAMQVLQHGRSRGYLMRVAIADTQGLAWGAARFLVSSEAQPTVIPIQDSQIMHSLPIRALRLSEANATTLLQLGVSNIGQLSKLPRRDLAARFGKEVCQRLDQMTAVLEEPIIARHKPPVFHSRKMLDFPTSDLETVNVIIQQLTTQLCSQLAAKQQGALEWTVKMHCQTKRLPLQFCVRLFQPTATAEHVMQLVAMQLEQVLKPQGPSRSENPALPRSSQPKRRKRRRWVTLLDGQKMEICEISVGVTCCVLLTQRQRHLFDENPRLNHQELAQLINRLASRLGTDHVVYPTLRRQAQPEHAFHFHPLIHPGKRRGRTSRYLNRQAHVLSRPTHLYSPPLLLEATPAAPPSSLAARSRTLKPPSHITFVSNAEGQPSTVAPHPSSAIRQRIVQSWGPERIETGWWRGPTTRRDYWRVETCSHQHFWIFRDLKNGCWFMHGAF